MTPALKKCPAVGNRQENSTRQIFKKSIRGGKLYSLFKKKEKKKSSVSVLGHEQKEKQALVYTVTHSDDPWNPWGAERAAGFQTGLLTYLELVQLYFICLM